MAKKRQGVIWGKTVASFEGSAAHVISRLADYVELHSTIAPQDAPLRQAMWSMSIRYLMLRSLWLLLSA